MAELYIDLRNRASRLIIADGGKIRFVHSVDQPLQESGQLAEILIQVKAGYGGSFSRTHLVIPSEEITVSLHKTQALEITDAEMIVRRAVIAETNDKDPVFHLTRMAAEQSQQVYLAEYIPRKVIEKYLRMFRLAGLKLSTITTSLQVYQALFPALYGEIHKVQAIFELGRHEVEAFFFSSSETLQYEFMAGRSFDGEGLEGPRENHEEDPERNERRKLYECMNNLHSLYSHFMNINPEASVEKIWLSGPESNLAGITEAISEGLGVEAGLLVPEEVSNLEEGHAFAALAGLLKLKAGKGVVNFIPPELQQQLRIGSGAICLIIGAIFTMAVLFGVAITERRYRDLQDVLKIEKNSLANLKSSAGYSRNQMKYLRQLREISRKKISFYEIFKELTVRLPSEIYLEGIEFKQGPDGNIVSLTAVTAYNSEFSNKRGQGEPPSQHHQHRF